MAGEDLHHLHGLGAKQGCAPKATQVEHTQGALTHAQGQHEHTRVGGGEDGQIAQICAEVYGVYGRAVEGHPAGDTLAEAEAGVGDQGGGEAVGGDNPQPLAAVVQQHHGDHIGRAQLAGHGEDAVEHHAQIKRRADQAA